MAIPGPSPVVRVGALVVASTLLGSSSLPAQSVADSRDCSREMLRVIKDELERYYYDPTFRGIDLDTHFAAAEQRLAGASSEGMMAGIIAQTLLELRDSHTFFIPPPLSMRVDYGWVMQMVGDTCSIVAVRPGSGAATSGLRAGDVVYAVEGVRPTRETLWKMKYSLRVLRPRTEVRLAVASEGRGVHEVVVKSDIRPRARFMQFQDFLEDMLERQRSPNRYADAGDVPCWATAARAR